MRTLNLFLQYATTVDRACQNKVSMGRCLAVCCLPSFEKCAVLHSRHGGVFIGDGPRELTAKRSLPQGVVCAPVRVMLHPPLEQAKLYKFSPGLLSSRVQHGCSSSPFNHAPLRQLAMSLFHVYFLARCCAMPDSHLPPPSSVTCGWSRCTSSV